MQLETRKVQKHVNQKADVAVVLTFIVHTSKECVKLW